jgi:hypothetical protein
MSSRQEDLCEICNNVPFRTLFEQEYNIWFAEAPRTIPQRNLEHIKKSKSCKCCRLTLAALGLNPDDAIDGHNATSWVLCRSHACTGTADRIDKPGRLISQLAEGCSTRPRPTRKFHFFIADLTSPYQTPEATHSIQKCYLNLPERLAMDTLGQADNDLFSGRLMSHVVSKDMIRLWLDRSPLEERIQTAFRTNFIDIPGKRLLSATTEVEYAALSYVWGEARQVLLDQEKRSILFALGGLNSFASALPRTIADAIELCESVGYEYLWVDALCIQQDDSEDKMRQINGMGGIYESASLTIVNACSAPGTNANSPLPGFSPGTRSVYQHEEDIQDQHIILTKRPPFAVAIRNSKWYSRGWTLQEFHLSKRLLFFTDHQVFLASNGARKQFFCEDTVFEHEDKDITTYCRVDLASSLLDWDHDPFSLDIFPSQKEQLLFLISAYGKRQLTHQEDALVAIQALMQRFQPELGEAIFGIPGKIFDYILCWSPAGGPISRRHTFPSWTWAGWEGAVSFMEDLDLKNNRRTWFANFGPGEARPVLDLAWEGSAVIDSTVNTIQTQPKLELRLKFETYGIQFVPRAASSNDVDNYYRRVLGHERKTGKTVQKDAYLHFTTSYYLFRIYSTDIGLPSSGSKGFQRSGAFYPMYPKIGVGGRDFISAIEGWRQQQSDELFIEFIAIYAVTNLQLVPIEWEPARACEHCDAKHQVARRIGQVSVIQNISIDEWMELDPPPKEKFIVLG